MIWFASAMPLLDDHPLILWCSLSSNWSCSLKTSARSACSCAWSPIASVCADILGMSLFDPFPDHSSLSRIRSRYGLEVFRRFFEAIVQQCQQEKLVWGKELYFDGTQVNANADLDSLTPRFAVEARAAIQAHLAALFTEEDTGHEQREAEAARADTPQTEAPAPVAIGSTPLPLPVVLSEAEQEELASENATRHDWIEQKGRQQREVQGLYQRTSDFK